MKKRKMVLTALAASALVVSMSLVSGVENAWAYFTTNTNAAGSHTVSLAAERTEIDESFSFADWTKTLTVTNGEGREVYVRAKVFGGGSYPLTVSGTGWNLNPADEYYYWTDGGSGILGVGQSTGVLQVKIGDVPDRVEEPESFDVVIVYETTPVQHDAAGNPYADWNLKLEDAEEGGN